MSKTVYSIVLDDDIIRAIDIMAVQEGTSRSNMINRILAQHISVPTVETIINDIYSSINELLTGHNSLAVQLLGNGSMINMRSALQYKYNPSVRYSVEIFENSAYSGQLKVSLRSQNRTLISLLDSFFYLWSQLEMQCCNIKDNEFTFGNGKYARLYRPVSSISHSEYGRQIAEYVNLMDSCMKKYFETISVSQAKAVQTVTKLYLDNITDELCRI